MAKVSKPTLLVEEDGVRRVVGEQPGVRWATTKKQKQTKQNGNKKSPAKSTHHRDKKGVV